MIRIHLSEVQRGVSLVISLVMLVVLTLVVLSGVSMSTSNVKSTANMAFRDEAFAAANLAIEQVVSTDFMNMPQTSMIPVDINQDGTNDYAVDVPAPVCVWWKPLMVTELREENPAHAPCFGGSRRGGIGPVNQQSFCAETRWAMRALVGESNTGATANKTTGAVVTVNQGISVLMNVHLAQNACK